MATGRNEILFRDVLENDYGKTATERDIKLGDTWNYLYGILEQIERI